ncbi:MAG: hypothetical protein R3E66_11705 [bacterium]
MTSRVLVTIAWFAMFTLFGGVAFAQKSGASVVILKFDRFNVPDDIMATFDKELSRAVEENDETYVKPGGELTIQDLALTAGCESPTVDCLSGLRDLVDADQIIFGSVQRSDDVFLFTIRNFDFGEGDFIREVNDQTVKGTNDEVREAIPAIVENFIFGPVGKLEVTLSGVKSAELFINGEKMGVAPTTLENLPLGEHVVMVRSDDGKEESQTVILRHNAMETLSFDLDSASPVSDSGERMSPAIGWAVVGVGLAAIGFGVYETLEVGRVDDDFDALCAREGNVCEGSNAALKDAATAAEADDLKSQGSTAKTLQLVGFSVGGAAALVGGYLLYKAYSGADEEAAASNMRFGVSPTADGAAASFQANF